MEDGDSLHELDDRYLLPYGRRAVTQVRIDHALTLLVEGGASVTIAQAASLITGSTDGGGGGGGDVHELVPDRQQVEPALALFGLHVLSAVAFRSGALLVEFEGGARLDVPSDGAYEAWNASGPGPILVVAQPGGGLAVWR
jgi:hypothetical protein